MTNNKNKKPLDLFRMNSNKIGISKKSKRNIFLNPIFNNIISTSKQNVGVLKADDEILVKVDDNNGRGISPDDHYDTEQACNNSSNKSVLGKHRHQKKVSTAATSTRSSESGRNNSNSTSSSWSNPSISVVSFPQNENEAVLWVLYWLSNDVTLDEIQTLVTNYPFCLSCTNTYGQTPLHVALMKGIRCNIIRYMLYKFPQACWIVDDYGKLPLHYAATSSKWIISLTNDDKEAIYDKHYMKMLNELCMTYPQGTIHEDNDGMNPIELCLLDDILPNHTFMKLLQKTSIKYWRKQVINKTTKKQNDVKTSCSSATTVGGTTTAANIAQTPATESQRRSIAGCAA